MRFIFVNKQSFLVLMFGIGIICLAWNLQGCSYPMPKVDVTMWAGDSAIASISRSQDNEHISCGDPKFEDYACLTYLDIRKIYSSMLQCQKWGPPIASASDIKQLLKKNKGVIHHALSISSSK